MRSLVSGIVMAGLLATVSAMGADKKVIFIAGPPSHGPGEHEHRAGCLLLQSCMAGVKGVSSEVYSNGWPADVTALEGASTIVIYSDGGGGHPFLHGDRLQAIGALMDKGVGLVAIHYAVEPTKEKGQDEWLKWIGGAFEVNWSVNPHWDADFKSLPKHPITKGVHPFKIRDEWYFNMRFRDNMKDVTAILTAIPDPSTTNRHDGPHEGNPAVRGIVARGEPVTVAWAATRPNGGRGFGFTGAHFHRNWANDDFRKLVLNAILWTAKSPIPREGVASRVTEEQMQANLDAKGRRR